MRRDPVTPEMAEHVRSRDNFSCIGPVVGMPGQCEGKVEFDHILNGGMSYRGPSTALNLASLCAYVHHPMKGADANRWRPLLVAFVARMEGVR